MRRKQHYPSETPTHAREQRLDPASASFLPSAHSSSVSESPPKSLGQFLNLGRPSLTETIFSA